MTIQRLQPFIASVVVLLQTACAATQESRAVPSELTVEPTVRLGMSIEDLQDAVDRCNHRFTVKRGAQTVRCVSAPVCKDRWPFYLVFVDDRLTRITERPELPMEIVHVDGRRIARRNVNLDKDVESVLDAPEVSPREATEIAGEKTRRGRAARERHSEPLPIPLVLWKLSETLGAPAREREAEKRRKILSQFDPMKIELGMSPQQVAEAFASKCVGERHVAPSVLRLYGDAEGVTTFRAPWVAVQFEDDLVIAVYSGDFFDPKWRES